MDGAPAWVLVLTAVTTSVTTLLASLAGLLVGLLVESRRDKALRRREEDARRAEAESVRRTERVRVAGHLQERLIEARILYKRYQRAEMASADWFEIEDLLIRVHAAITVAAEQVGDRDIRRLAIEALKVIEDEVQAEEASNAALRSIGSLLRSQ